MPESKRPKTTDEILREMEEMSKGVSDSDSKPQAAPKSEGGGALKSLLGFFIKVHDEDEQAPAANPAHAPGAPQKGQPAAKGQQPNLPQSGQRRVEDLVANEPVPKFAPPKKSLNADLSVKPFEELYAE